MTALLERPREACRLGQGAAHQALQEAKDRHQLVAAAEALGCRCSDIASEDGHRLDMHRCLDLMRNRGYKVGEPQRQQHRDRKGFITWWVFIDLPSGPGCAIAFHTPEVPTTRR